MSRDLGDLGELVLQAWCAEIGITANKPTKDKYGWDFYLEFPQQIDLTTEFVHKAPAECKVQVKATDKRNRGIAIELSNLYRLVTSPHPVFYLFLEFDGHTAPKKAFLLHLDKEIIEKVLKRVYTSEQSIKKRPLNKQTITLKYGPENELAELTGAFFKTAILKYVGKDFQEYIRKKSITLENAGFENGGMEINFKVSQESLSDFVDVVIGLKKEIEVRDLSFFTTRFGLQKSLPHLSNQSAVLSMQPVNDEKGFILLQRDSFSPGLKLNAVLHSPPAELNLSNDILKVRIECDYFDIVFSPNLKNNQFSMNLSRSSKVDVSELTSLLKLLSYSVETNEKIIMTFDFKKLQKPISLRMDGFSGLRDFLNDELQFLNNILLIKDSFDVKDNILVSYDHASNHREKIKTFGIMLTQQDSFFKVCFNVTESSYNNSVDTVYLAMTNVYIGDFSFIIIFSLKGRPEIIDGEDYRYILYTNNINIERKLIIRKDQDVDYSAFLNLVRAIEEQYEPHYSVITGIDKRVYEEKLRALNGGNTSEQKKDAAL